MDIIPYRPDIPEPELIPPSTSSRPLTYAEALKTGYERGRYEAGLQAQHRLKLAIEKERKWTDNAIKGLREKIARLEERNRKLRVLAASGTKVRKRKPIITPAPNEIVDRGIGNRPLLPAPASTIHHRKFYRAIRPSVRFRVFQRDNYCCRLCGAHASDTRRLEIDHIHPVSRGGSGDEDNLWVLCWECNSGKSNHPL